VLSSGSGDAQPWALRSVSFRCKEAESTLICDSGAGATAVSSAFVAKARLEARPLSVDLRRAVHVATGEALMPLGVVDLPKTVQLILNVEDGKRTTAVHWDRQFTLRNVWVLDLGPSSPRDLYVSWADWRFSPGQKAPESSLGHLTYLVSAGATLVNSPRSPSAGTPTEALQVVALRRSTGKPDEGLAAAAIDPVPSLTELVRARIDEVRGTGPRG